MVRKPEDGVYKPQWKGFGNFVLWFAPKHPGGGGHFLLPTLQETLPCVANANKIKVTNSKCDVQL